MGGGEGLRRGGGEGGGEGDAGGEGVTVVSLASAPMAGALMNRAGELDWSRDLLSEKAPDYAHIKNEHRKHRSTQCTDKTPGAFKSLKSSQPVSV